MGLSQSACDMPVGITLVDPAPLSLCQGAQWSSPCAPCVGNFPDHPPPCGRCTSTHNELPFLTCLSSGVPDSLPRGIRRGSHNCKASVQRNAHRIGKVVLHGVAAKKLLLRQMLGKMVCFVQKNTGAFGRALGEVREFLRMLRKLYAYDCATTTVTHRS